MSVREDVRGSVAELTLDRPDAMNALTREVAADLQTAVDDAMADDAIGALLVRGAGDKAFCAGADVPRFAQAIEDGNGREVVGELSRSMNTVLERLVEGPKPVVAAVDGVAAGGGLGLALAADIRLAGPGARFATAFRDVAVSPDGATTWLLPRIVGYARARSMLLENQTVDGETAREWGLVQALAKPGQVYECALERARDLASGPSRMMACTKRLLADQRSFGEHVAREASFTRESAGTAAFREGIEAFVEGRAPNFEALDED
jgi:2-(1,2-epoxy-1,2-dihydrophenyl)acetyl-CoA isomerase